MADKPDHGCELTILMPCLNEAETIGACIQDARSFIKQHNIQAEILIADNGSMDGSPEIALAMGARVVRVERKGYGSALMGGISAAKGRYIIMGDADHSYDFTELMPFVEKLRDGYDLVMGNRFKGGIRPGAMPALHRLLGNPLLSGLGRLFFNAPVGDFHSGLRGFSKSAIEKMDLRTTGMEFASEMVIKATLLGMSIAEVPVTLSPHGRSGAPHLRTWRDGWRHLRFLLLYSPRWLFFYPGLVLCIGGIALSLRLLIGPIRILGTALDIHTLLFASMAVVMGYQLIIFALFTKLFAISERLLPPDPRLDRIARSVRMETGVILGSFLFLAGIVTSLAAFVHWESRSFGPLDPRVTFRLVIPAVALSLLGLQTVFSSFFLSVLGLSRKG